MLRPVCVQGWVGDKYLKNLSRPAIGMPHVRKVEAATFLPKTQKEPTRVTIKKKFFADARARNLSEATLYKYTILLERQFARGSAICIDQVDTYVSRVSRRVE